jgi:predicted CopG family antitoxin
MNRQILDAHAWLMHDACMATKTISLETDAYDLLKKEKLNDRESFSQVVRRLFSERPALTAGELLEALKPFEGKGAGKRRPGRHAAA